MPDLNEVPNWFNVALLAGALVMVSVLSGIAVALLKYVINKNQNEMAEMKTAVTDTSLSVKTVTENVNALVSTVKLHEYRINEQSIDIKEIQRSLNGHIVS